MGWALRKKIHWVKNVIFRWFHTKWLHFWNILEMPGSINILVVARGWKAAAEAEGELFWGGHKNPQQVVKYTYKKKVQAVEHKYFNSLKKGNFENCHNSKPIAMKYPHPSS